MSTTGGAPIAFRLNPDGSLDGTFGTGGKVDLAVLGATGITVDRVLVAGDGTIYVAGDGSVAGFTRDAVWALTSAGAPKLSFNGTGSRLLPTVSGSDNDIGDAALTPSGEVAVAAVADARSRRRHLPARCHGDRRGHDRCLARRSPVCDARSDRCDGPARRPVRGRGDA